MRNLDIIRRWKNEDGDMPLEGPASPVGDELTEAELLQVSGGARSNTANYCTESCTERCTVNCTDRCVSALIC